MNSEQLLERYILSHPDFWEYENERKEVERLKALCKQEAERQIVLSVPAFGQEQLCAC